MDIYAKRFADEYKTMKSKQQLVHVKNTHNTAIKSHTVGKPCPLSRFVKNISYISK